jgi:hypothetical protein
LVYLCKYLIICKWPIYHMNRPTRVSSVCMYLHTPLLTL